MINGFHEPFKADPLCTIGTNGQSPVVFVEAGRNKVFIFGMNGACSPEDNPREIFRFSFYIFLTNTAENLGFRIPPEIGIKKNSPEGFFFHDTPLNRHIGDVNNSTSRTNLVHA